tara:strand:- start:730 stop:1011 length:282 start_codon:yes stop_codon:yes gene_type:complete
MVNQDAIDALVDWLETVGEPTQPKNGDAQGLTIYNPKPFNEAQGQALASRAGLNLIYTPNPSVYEGKQFPPKLYIGKKKSMEKADTKAFFQSL